jgi:Domain of unknown function (DUF4105)
MRRFGWWVLAIAAVELASWGALGLHFSGPRPAVLADALAVGLVLATVVVLGWVRPLGRTLVALAILFVVFNLWWGSLEARNDRDWQPSVARTAHVELVGDRLTVHNVRNFDYRSETDFTERWEDRTLDLSRLSGLDLFMSYWGSPSIAHTILSWDFDDGQHLAISIETRNEKGEQYSAVAGFFKQYEIYYVVADERDVIRLRTNYRKEEVHLYPLRTPVARARRILLDYVASINALAERAEFYNAATANCTTSITAHLKKVGINFPFDWRVIVNGRLDELLYEHGMIDTTHPFAEVRQLSKIDARAQAADQDPAFSARIREGLARPPLLVLPAGTQ